MHTSASDSDAVTEQLVSVARTALGDSLRTVVLFTPGDFAVLYGRTDVVTEDTVIEDRFVANERLGFTSQETYDTIAARPETEPAIGEYRYTVRAFEDGYVGRVLGDGRGVLVTTDTLSPDDFDEFAVATKRVLADGPR